MASAVDANMPAMVALHHLPPISLPATRMTLTSTAWGCAQLNIISSLQAVWELTRGLQLVCSGTMCPQRQPTLQTRPAPGRLRKLPTQAVGLSCDKTSQTVPSVGLVTTRLTPSLATSSGQTCPSLWMPSSSQTRLVLCLWYAAATTSVQAFSSARLALL